MSWFVDASVIVALSIGEAGWEHQAALMDEEPVRLWSAIARWESVAATRLRMRCSTDDATAIVQRTADENGLSLVTIGSEEAGVALNAYQRFGKGMGHPAQLNMGDCFAYACAKTNSARLLYKGDDFSHTDMAL